MSALVCSSEFVGLKDYSQYPYVFFFTQGCSGCRSKFLFTLIDNKWYNKCAVIISQSNVHLLEGFRHKNIYIDSTNYLASHNVNFMTDGFLETMPSGKTDIIHINIQNVDALIDFFKKEFQ